MNSNFNNEKRRAAEAAVTFIRSNQTIGLGSGSTVRYAIEAIGELVKNGLVIRAVPTSRETARLASALSIPLVAIGEVDHLDLNIDGADEFTGDLQMIKGGGGALFRERIVALMSDQVIIIADSSKKVALLGKFTVPVETAPFAMNYVTQQLHTLNGQATLRLNAGIPMITEQGNHILDVDFGLISQPQILSAQLNNIAGIVSHGLFIGIANKIMMCQGNELIVFDGIRK
ncbi:MAG: ribose 5-phosphate isomerase [Ferruginibacter sp.]|nr:ribose 5-phosphate isomerase [Ferruginibacter sp.]